MAHHQVQNAIIHQIAKLSAGTRIGHCYAGIAEIAELVVASSNHSDEGRSVCVWILPEELSEPEAQRLLERQGMVGNGSVVIPLSVTDGSFRERIGNGTLAELLTEMTEGLVWEDVEALWVFSAPAVVERSGPVAVQAVEAFLAHHRHLCWRIIEQTPLEGETVFGAMDRMARYPYMLTRRAGVWTLTENQIQQEVRRELEDAKNFYLTLFADFPALIWRAGTDALCNYFNHNWLAFTGRTLEQEMGNGWAEGVHPEDFDRCVAYYLEHFEQRKPFRMEYRLKRHDGEYRWILDMGMPFNDLKGVFAGYIGSCYDITDHKNMEDHLRVQADEEREANQAKSIFLSQVSHELRTPLNAIVGMMQLLRETPLDGEQQEYVELTKGSAQRLTRLINDLIDVSRLETGFFELESVPFDMLQLVRSVYESLRVGVASGVNMELAIPEAALFLRGDPWRVSQILVNLIGNGLKFTKAGTVKVSLELNRETDTEVSLSLRVADTGVGIPADKIQLLFRRFSQVTANRFRRREGSGLGLEITKMLVQRMGGEIGVESEEGVGSTFTVTLTLPKCRPEEVLNSPSEFQFNG